MKLAGARALAFCEQPPAKARIALVFGADPGLVAEAADMLARAWLPKDADPLNLVRLDEDTLKRDPLILVDELIARSLLGGERLVRTRIEKETAAKPVIETLGDIETGLIKPEACWIVEGGDLGKTSKLRAAFEASESAMACHLFSDDEATIGDLVNKRLKQAGVTIEPDALATFVAELPGDRRLALSEIEKLELYALDLGRSVQLADIQKLASAEQPRGADDAADAAILGDKTGAALNVNRYLDAGGNAVSALRTLHFRMLRVVDAAGGSPGPRLRPPIFDKEWPPFQRALKDWPSAKLNRVFGALYDAEKSCKQAGAPSDAILRRLIDRIAAREV